MPFRIAESAGSMLSRPVVRHLAVEATRLLQEKRGIGRYVRNVLRELASLQPTLHVTLFVSHTSDAAPLAALLAEWSPLLAVRTNIETVDHLPQIDADVVWYPWNFVTARAERATMVVTVHDLAPMLQHDHRWWKVLKRARARRKYARTLRSAHAVITDAASTMEELFARFDADASRISVVPLAADDMPVHLPDDDTPLREHGVTGPFFLVVGGQDARKNLATLYRAMERLWARGVRVPLVQCGPAPCRETRERLGRTPWLTHVGYVTDAQLATLYRRTSALVFPSRYEGFGLPVLEAMRMGAPVVCADTSSLPEVGGEAVHYTDVCRAESLADAMQQVYEHPEHANMLRARGLVRSEGFSWRATAQGTLLAFERAVLARGVRTLPQAVRAPYHTGITGELPGSLPGRASAPLTAPAVVRAASRLGETHDR